MNVRVALSALAAILALSISGFAQTKTPSGPPASRNPNGIFPLLKGTKEAPLKAPRDILAKLHKDVALITAEIKQIREAKNASLKKVKPQDVGAVVVHLQRMIRDVEHLMMWGEPSAVGFKLELDKLLSEQRHLVTTIRDDTFFKSKLTRAVKSLHTRTRAMTGILERKVDPLIEKGRLADAFVVLENVVLPYTTMFDFYENQEFQDERKQIRDRWIKIYEPLKEARRGAVRRQIGTIRRAWLPKYDSLWRSIDDEIIKIRQKESSEAGSELLARIAADWRTAHIGGMRCQALDWAIACSLEGSDGEEKQKWDAARNELISEHNQFTDKMAELVVALIEAETNRSTPEKIVAIYPRYLRSLSALIAISALDPDGKASNDFRKQIEDAMAAMASKSDELTQSIAEYDAATNELLKWREDVAAAYAERTHQTFSPLNDILLRSATRSPRLEERLLVDEKQTLDELAINSYARIPTNFISEKLSGVKVVVRNGIGLRNAERYPLKTRFAERSYTGFYGDPAWLSSALSHLESDLLINPQRPIPLTLNAQLALDSGRRGDVIEYGGRIEAILLESVLTRQASIQSNDWGMIRLGKLDATSLSKDTLSRLRQAQLRLAIRPSWLRNRYFFVELPASNAGGG